MHTISLIFVLISGMKWLNSTRKAIETCHDEHSTAEPAIIELCVQHGDKMRRTLLYGVFALALGTPMMWHYYGAVSTLRFAGTVAVWTAIFCWLISFIRDVRISRYERLKTSGLRT